MSVDPSKYVRDLVVEGITNRLRQITIANGYDYDIGDHVYVLSGMASDLPLPAAMLMETGETVRIRAGGLYSCTLSISIVLAAIYGGPDPDAEGRKLLGNIQRAMVKPALELSFLAIQLNSNLEGRTVAQIEEAGNQMNASDPIQNETVVQIDYVVKYDRSIDDPRRIL